MLSTFVEDVAGWVAGWLAEERDDGRAYVKGTEQSRLSLLSPLNLAFLQFPRGSSVCVELMKSIFLKDQHKINHIHAWKNSYFRPGVDLGF